MITIRPNKYLAKLLNWVRKARSDDPWRAPLQGMFLDRPNQRVLACDGVRVHIAKLCEKDFASIPDVIIGDLPAASAILVPLMKILADRPNEFESLTDVAYPDTDSAFPKAEPVLTIAVNPRYLLDALQGFQDVSMVHLKFHGPESPFTLSSVDEERVALLMPMYLKE